MKKWYLIICLIALAVMILGWWQSHQRQNMFCFLDVGQGDAALAWPKDGPKVLIDGGPGGTLMDDLSTLIPFSDRKIDWIVLSHPHADHINGLLEVLEKFQVDYVVMDHYHEVKSYQRLIKAVKAEGSHVYVADAEEDFQLPGITLDIVYPLKEGHWLNDNLNDRSVSLRVIMGERSFFLSGDLEKPAELALARSGQDLRAKVMKAGHHGSKTSNSVELISAVQPQEVVVSVGKKNKYKHPSPEVLERWRKLGLKVRRTDSEGTICYVWQ